MKLRYALSVFLAVPFAAQAQEPPKPDDMPKAGDVIETVYVWGKREAQLGEAQSASEGAVSYGSFAGRPLLRVGELAEAVPGVAVTQHSGTGKANQYFLRGFNLDHGTDFSVMLDGVPLNLRSHAHGQGYLDLNILIPELIETIRYRKGPYYASHGDFSTAGSAAFESFGSPEGSLSLTGGSNRYGRLLYIQPAGASYAAIDLTTSDGPWERDENLRKGNFALGHQMGEWSLSLMGYRALWDATDQVPLRAVQSGALPRLGAVDPTDGGDTTRFILSARTKTPDGLDAVFYVQRYQLDLFSNFTYFLDDPVNGDQFSQQERRWIMGGSLSRDWRLSPDWTLKAGGELRYDAIGRIGLYRTQARNILSTDREDSIDQGSLDLWGEAEWKSGPLRASLGLRVAGMGADVNSDNPLNSGRAWDHVAAPKFMLAYQMSERVELYANLGRGFHSNDARGATARVAPGSGLPIDAVNLYAPGWGGELGARYETPDFSATLALWALNLSSELVYVGDAGDTSAAGATRRLGAELLLNWTVLPGLNLDFSAATTHARFRDAPGMSRIPNAIQYVLAGGAGWSISDDMLAQATFRRLGPAPLTEDGSVHSKPSTLINLLLRQDFPRFSLSGEVLNVFNARDNDITYYYGSRLPGEPLAGVDDIHQHPMEPRSFRVSVKIPF